MACWCMPRQAVSRRHRCRYGVGTCRPGRWGSLPANAAVRPRSPSWPIDANGWCNASPGQAVSAHSPERSSPSARRARCPGPIGEGHIDVARRVAQGGGRAGITMEAAARAFGLGFMPLEAHVVEFWLDERWASLPAAVAMVEVLGGSAFTRRTALLDGYDLAGCGTERHAS